MMRVPAISAVGLLTGCAFLGGRGPDTVAAGEGAYACARQAVQGLGYQIVEEADPQSGAPSLVAERTLQPDAAYPVIAELYVSAQRTPRGTQLRVTGARYEERAQRGGGRMDPTVPPRPAPRPDPGPSAGPKGWSTVVRVGGPSSRGRMRLSPGPAEEDAAAVRAQCGRPPEERPAVTG